MARQRDQRASPAVGPKLASGGGVEDLDPRLAMLTADFNERPIWYRGGEQMASPDVEGPGSPNQQPQAFAMEMQRPLYEPVTTLGQAVSLPQWAPEPLATVKWQTGTEFLGYLDPVSEVIAQEYVVDPAYFLPDQAHAPIRNGFAEQDGTTASSDVSPYVTMPRYLA